MDAMDQERFERLINAYGGEGKGVWLSEGGIRQDRPALYGQTGTDYAVTRLE